MATNKKLPTRAGPFAAGCTLYAVRPRPGQRATGERRAEQSVPRSDTATTISRCCSCAAAAGPVTRSRSQRSEGCRRTDRGGDFDRHGVHGASDGETEASPVTMILLFIDKFRRVSRVCRRIYLAKGLGKVVRASDSFRLFFYRRCASGRRLYPCPEATTGGAAVLAFSRHSAGGPDFRTAVSRWMPNSVGLQTCDATEGLPPAIDDSSRSIFAAVALANVAEDLAVAESAGKRRKIDAHGYRRTMNDHGGFV